MCFGCGAEGDVLDFVMRLYGVRLVEALEMLDGELSSPPNRAAHAANDETHDRTAEALAIWNSARPAQATVAEAYLKSRGINGAIARYHPLCGAAARSTLPDADARCSGCRRLRAGLRHSAHLPMRGSGRKAALPGGEVKFPLGRVRGGAIRLGPPARSIIVTEGLEDGLTLLQALGRTVWVAAGAGMLPAMRLPNLIGAVVIGADNDESGQEAAERAAEAFHDQGRHVRIMSPGKAYKDFNAQLMGRGG